MINNIFFDVYQTLATIDLKNEDENKAYAWNVVAEFVRYKYDIIITGSELEAKRDEQIELFYQSIGGKNLHYNFVDIIQKTFKYNRNIVLSKQESADLLMMYRIMGRGYLELYNGVKETIESLKSQGKKVYAVSYTQRAYTEQELKDLDIWSLFDGSCFSSDISKKKKHPEFYTEVLNRFGVKAEETLMIGDNYNDDVLAPRSIGMQSIWLENPVSSHKYTVPGEEQQRTHLKDFANLKDMI